MKIIVVIQIIVIFLILVVTAVRWAMRAGKKKAANHLWVSCLVQAVAFGYGKALITFLGGQKLEDDAAVILGPFGNSIRFEFVFALCILLVFIGYSKVKTHTLKGKNNIWFLIFSGICIVSYFNPINAFKQSFLPAFFLILQLTIVFKLIESNFTREELLHGIFDGLLFVSVLQFILTICYPILGLQSVATLFKGDKALEWAQRRSSRSAIGSFGHPAMLALFSLITTVFFLSCFFNDFKAKLSKRIVLINLFVILFTLSRTTYVCSIAIILIIVLVKKREGGIFTVRNIFSFLFLFSLVIGVLYLTPVKDLFLKSDASEQYENRFAHWLLGYQMWSTSPFFGVGFNSHVYYMLNKLLVTVTSPVIAFLIRSPIHNIHLIVLAETGVLGFFFWLFFFISRISRHSKNCNSGDYINNILSLTLVGVLITLFIYGFLGWSPLRVEIVGISLMFINLAKVSEPKDLKKKLRR